jgi:hypothetical protein
MNYFLLFLAVLVSATVLVAQLLISRRRDAIMAYAYLRKQLQLQTDRIPEMLEVVKHRIPEYGNMLEKIVGMRLALALKTDAATKLSIRQEIHLVLSDLLTLTGGSDLIHDKEVEKAKAFYLSSVQSYNTLAMKFSLGKIAPIELAPGVSRRIEGLEEVPEILAIMAG